VAGVAANLKCGGNDPAASANSMRRESYSCLPLGATDVRALVGSPDLANMKQAMVALSSKVVTTAAPSSLGLYLCHLLPHWTLNPEDGGSMDF
jgi:hypothetical protein